jgi:regulatory protein
MDQDKPKKKQVKQAKTLSESYLRNAGLYYLQRHPTSIAHFLAVMDRKMQRSARAHPDQDITLFKKFVRERLVPEFERAGFLNDALYASALAASLRRRGLPHRVIANRLKMKGVGVPLVPEGHDDLRAAFIYARRKRLGPFATKDRDPQKDLAALARAGFSYDICRRVMSSTGLDADIPDMPD